MGAVMFASHKSEALCIKSEGHLNDVIPIDMKQTTRSMIREV